MSAGRTALAALALVLVVAAAATAQDAFDLETSHSGAVTDLVFDDGRELLVSAGEDGSIRIWDAPRGRVSAVLRVSHQPIQRIAVHPSLPQVAALIGGSVRGGEVVVWDWAKRTQLYSLEYKEQILSLRYSPGGTYLLATRANFDSLTLLDPSTGRSLFYMRKGFGIVSFAVVSRNENNIMTYQPSGVITYWDIKSGRTLKQVRTLADLRHIALSPNYRFAAAAYGDSLAVVDLLTGDRIDERQVPGVSALAFSPQGNEIMGIVQTESGAELQQWYFGGRFLLQLTAPWAKGLASTPGMAGEPLAVVYGAGRIYIGNRQGTIAALQADGSVEVVARDRLLWHSDAAVLGNRIALAGRERIHLLESSFLSEPVGGGARGASLEPAPVSIRTLPNPLGDSAGSGTGVEFLDPRTLLLWTLGEEDPRIGILEIGSGRFQELALELSSPLKQVCRYPRGIVIVDESGACLILDPFSFQPRFRYRSPGMNKVVFAVGDTLVGGRTSLSTFGSPLLQINERTGETVAISDPGLFVYNLIFEPEEVSLFTLSVDSRSESPRTLLKVHSGYGFERSRVLAEYRGEDLGAGLVSDASGRVYSSLGYERVGVWDGERLQRMDDAQQVHRALYATADKLVAANRDGSLSFWESGSRRFLLTLYLFDDLSWLAALPGGRTYSPRE